MGNAVNGCLRDWSLGWRLHKIIVGGHAVQYTPRDSDTRNWRTARARQPGDEDTPNSSKLVYDTFMSRTNIELNDALVRKARKLTRLKTKRAVVDKALELLVRSETRKGILRYYGTGIWIGDLKRSRRNRA